MYKSCREKAPETIPNEEGQDRMDATDYFTFSNYVMYMMSHFSIY